MIVTLTGANNFLLQRELKKLVAAFVAEQGDLALERVDGEEADFARLQEVLTSLPFLASKKMVLLQRPSANKQFAEQAAGLLAAVPETTEVVLVEPKLDKRASYYKWLKAKTEYREFAELDANGLVQWLVREAAARGGKLGLSDARYLVERCGSNQQLLGNELDKLLLHSPTISRTSIDELTEATPQSTIFQLLEAAFAGEAKRALRLYEEQRALGVEVPQLIAMLTWQLQVLAIVKTAGDKSADEIAHEAKLNPFVVRKTQTIAAKLPFAELKRLLADLLVIDRRSKRENIDADEALQHYLLVLARG